ncbi:MAG TPA: hypothetical protein VFX30_14430 [bacterium]|nr:hypothetical protein [bacterium]
MTGRIRAMCRLFLVLLGVLFATTAVQAREAPESEVDAEEAAAEKGLVYDYKTGVFVRIPRVGPPEYRIGNLKVDVGYDEQIVRTKDAWPESVNRLRYRRLFDQ